MLWVIWDIFIPLLVAFLAGLFFGWLFWRWRRIRLSREELATIRRSNLRYKSDADMLRSRNAEMAERLRAESGVNDPALVQEIEEANKRIDDLQGLLDKANSALANTRSTTNSGRSVGIKTRTTEIEDNRNAASNPGEDYDLSEEIAVRDKMIATLTRSLEQYGSEADSTALKAELELRKQRIVALEGLLNDSQRVA